MGCTLAKEHNGDHFPRTFKVYNVDDQGQERNAGKIEITDTELVLYQKGKEPFRWPLRSLRRYGFDAELFSFESGRRCPTGPGIYAFKCQRAEALFNLLQECIQRAGQEEQQHTTNGMTDVSGNVGDSRHSFVEFRQVAPALSDLPHAANPLHVYVNSTLLVANGRDAAAGGDMTDMAPGGGAHEYVNTAITSLKDPASHTSLAAMAVDTDSVVLINRTESSAMAMVPTATWEHTIQYAELDLPNTELDADNGGSAVVSNGFCRLKNHCLQHSCVDESERALSMYVNLSGGAGGATARCVRRSRSCCGASASEGGNIDTEDPHSYANLGLLSAKACPPVKCPKTVAGARVNYIQLDLKSEGSDCASNGHQVGPTSPGSSTSNQDSPVRLGISSSTATESYAMIDFHKTAALNAKTAYNDEGFRKTRHNSNIDELYSD